MSVNVRTVLSKVTSYLSFFSWKNVKAILSPSNTTGVIWQYFAGSLAWLVVVGMAAMNLRTYLTYPANSPQVGVTYYSFLTLHGWSAMLGLVPNAAIAVIAYSMYKNGLSIRRTRLMSALFWISNLGLLFALLGGPDMGWYMYPPLAIEDNSNFHAFLLYRGAMIGIAYLALALNSMAQTIATIVLVGDAYATKPRGQKLGIFAAYGVAFAVIIALTLPALTAAELWYSLYFLASVPVNTLLWLVLFWFYGHPVVYYVPFPLFGALYYYVPKFAGRELFSEKWARWNIYLLAIGSMLIWVHHIQTFPIPVAVRLWINLSTLILASGSGLTVLNLGLTVLLSKGYNFRDPVGMATLMALVGFILGGVQAVPLPMFPINPIVHNTYYVVGHFHLVIWTLILMGFTAVFLDLLRTVRPGFDSDAVGMMETAFSALSSIYGSPWNKVTNRETAIKVIARASTVVTNVLRAKEGKKPRIPEPSDSFARSFLEASFNRTPSTEEVKAMDASLILYADHEVPASTTAALVTSSTLSDMYSCVVAALAALKGPLHGGAAEEAFKQFLEIGSPENTDQWFQKKIVEGKARLMGFGHRVYKTYDPRAKLFKRFAKQLSERNQEAKKYFEIAQKVEELGIQMFSQKHIFPNTDFYSGVVFYALGFPVYMFTSLFALSRTLGWTAHVIEYVEEQHRLIRPRALYVGPIRREVIPIELRG